MNVLSGLNNIKKCRKLLGVKIPPEVFDYLTLYSTAKGKSKSSIVYSLIEEWMKGKVQNYTIPSLRDDIISKLTAYYKSQNTLSITEFKEETEKTLQGKGLDKQHITYILKHLKDDTKKISSTT